MVLSTRPNLVCHTPFFERAQHGTPAERERAIGAYLAIGCLDKLQGAPGPLRQATGAALEFNRLIEPPDSESLALMHVVLAIQNGGYRGTDAVWNSVLVYGRLCRDAARLAESVDVLQSALAAMGGLESSWRPRLLLDLAYLHRCLSDMDAARQTYEWAYDSAGCCGMIREQLLARLGVATLLGRWGDFNEAKAQLLEVAALAGREEELEVEAKAWHDLGALYIDRGDGRRGAIQCYMAYERYKRFDDEYLGRDQKCRVLADIATALGIMGLDDAAQIALELVVRDVSSHSSKVSAMIELLEVTSRCGDRLSFRRWHDRIVEAGRLVPRQQVDFDLKCGTASARSFRHPSFNGSVSSVSRFTRTNSLNRKRRPLVSTSRSGSRVSSVGISSISARSGRNPRTHN